jgi:Tfp pilus assembly protein PilP
MTAMTPGREDVGWRGMMTAIGRWAAVLLLIGLAGPPAWPARAQEKKVPAPGERGQLAATQQPVTEGYSYKPEGRRDPFVSLTAVRSVDRVPGKRPEGLAGVLVDEAILKGILQSRQTYIASIQAPDMKTYIVHVGDRLLDGTVKAITADRVVFLKEVNDPLSLIKQKEVLKILRSLEEVK